MNRMYEELALNAWPALITHHYDGWLLNYANGYTKRANSVYPIYDSTLDKEDKIMFCEDYYQSRGLKPTFKMNDSDMLRILDMCLEDKGYHVVDPTDVMVMALSQSDDKEILEYQVNLEFDNEWAKTYTELVGISGEDEQSLVAKRTIKEMLSCITQQPIYICFKDGENAVAIGYGVVERGYLGIFNIIVHEAYRGKGYGHHVMNAIQKEGQKLGAKSSYLQVVCENQIAVNLYKKLGYEKLYTYWYRRKEPLDV